MSSIPSSKASLMCADVIDPDGRFQSVLDLDGDRLYAFDMNTPNTVYAGPFFNYEWRGFHHFAQLDEAQMDGGIELTLDVCRRHEIEPVFYYPSTTIDFPRCFQVATIVCHWNSRADKMDL